MHKLCFCGDPECPRCFPYSYQRNALANEYMDEDTDLSFDEWLEDVEDDRLAGQYETIRDIIGNEYRI